MYSGTFFMPIIFIPCLSSSPLRLTNPTPVLPSLQRYDLLDNNPCAQANFRDPSLIHTKSPTPNQKRCSSKIMWITLLKSCGKVSVFYVD
jgi:hypothetical protein